MFLILTNLATNEGESLFKSSAMLSSKVDNSNKYNKKNLHDQFHQIWHIATLDKWFQVCLIKTNIFLCWEPIIRMITGKNSNVKNFSFKRQFSLSLLIVATATHLRDAWLRAS